MKKLKKALKERGPIIVFTILSFMYFLFNILKEDYDNLDEIWNFMFAKNIVDGLVSYKDFNMIVLPFAQFVEAILLKIFGTKLIVHRIIGASALTLLVYLTYKLLRKFFTNKYVSCLLVFIISELVILNIDTFYDYNVMLLILTLGIVNLEISLFRIITNKENKLDENLFKNKVIKYNLFIGLLAGFAIITKQTIGLFISIATIINMIISYNYFKRHFIINDKIKNIKLKEFLLFRLLGILAPGIITLISLVVNGALNDCIDFCLLGIKEFTNRITLIKYLELNSLGLGIVTITSLILIITTIITIIVKAIMTIKLDKKIEEKENDEYLRLIEKLFISTITISNLLMVYPIFDSGHFKMGAYLGIFLVVIVLGLLLKNTVEKYGIDINKEIIFIINIFISIFFVALMIIKIIAFSNIYINKNKAQNYDILKHIPVYDGYIDNLFAYNVNVNKYKEKGKDLYYLDSEAVSLDLPLGIYRKYYDLLNIGNIGIGGEDKIIEDIKRNKDNRVYLVKNRSLSINWQSCKKVLDYVLDNSEIIEKMGNVEIRQVK